MSLIGNGRALILCGPDAHIVSTLNAHALAASEAAKRASALYGIEADTCEQRKQLSSALNACMVFSNQHDNMRGASVVRCMLNAELRNQAAELQGALGDAIININDACIQPLRAAGWSAELVIDDAYGFDVSDPRRFARAELPRLGTDCQE